VSHAIVQDVAASWVEYERVARGLIDPAPAGLILHVAGPTDEGVRTIDVWETEEAWQRFRDERLAPSIGALGGAAHPEPSLRELRPLQLVLGRGPRSGKRSGRPQTASETGERQ
jgi:hypothetical protein